MRYIYIIIYFSDSINPFQHPSGVTYVSPSLYYRVLLPEVYSVVHMQRVVEREGE